ncbi:MAG TPA: hypothetical protein VF364_10245 [Candidatus Limnocylindria bacterium]
MHAHELAEQVAAVVLLGVAVFVLPASWLARRKALAQPEAAAQVVARPDRTTMEWAARAVAATLALGTAAILAGLAPSLLHGSMPHGLALGGLAVVHMVVAGFALSGHLFRARGPALVIVAGVIVATSNAIDPALGPVSWQPGSPGQAGATATGFELGLLAVLVVATPVRLRRRIGSRMREVASVAIVPLVGILFTVAMLVAVSVSAGSPGGHDHSVVPEPDPSAPGSGIARAPVPAQ